MFVFFVGTGLTGLFHDQAGLFGGRSLHDYGACGGLVVGACDLEHVAARLDLGTVGEHARQLAFGNHLGSLAGLGVNRFQGYVHGALFTFALAKNA